MIYFLIILNNNRFTSYNIKIIVSNLLIIYKIYYFNLNLFFFLFPKNINDNNLQANIIIKKRNIKYLHPNQ